MVATATDDRNLTTTAQTSINVAGAAGPPAATNNEVQFAKGSARVDNKAKAILDGVALLMQQQADSTAVVIGMPDSESKAGAKLALARAAQIRFAGRGYRLDGAGTDYPSSPVRRYEALAAMHYF